MSELSPSQKAADMPLGIRLCVLITINLPTLNRSRRLFCLVMAPCQPLAAGQSVNHNCRNTLKEDLRHIKCHAHSMMLYVYCVRVTPVPADLLSLFFFH